MHIQAFILRCSGPAGVMLHEVDVQVGGGVERGQQVGDLCHKIYKGWKIRIQLE